MKTLEELLGVNGTLVMAEDDIRTYAFERKLHPDQELADEQLRKLRQVRIHNAQTTREVEGKLESSGLDDRVKYFPIKSSEAHFYVPRTGDIHVVNSRGVTRQKRDENLAAVLGYFAGREVPVIIDHGPDGPAQASNRFEQYAFHLVQDVFSALDKKAIAESRRVSILLGPHGTLDIDDVDVIEDNKNDYLNYRIFKIGNEVVINFDYIFADQAKNILHMLYSTVSAEFKGVDINVFHYGRVGILGEAVHVGNIVVPKDSMDEEEIANGRGYSVFPTHNELAGKGKALQFFEDTLRYKVAIGTTVNTVSVIGQTVEGLSAARRAGGAFLDMEWAVMSGLYRGMKSTYPELASIRHFFAGIGSDKPLAHQTLGNTAYPVEQERLVANAFKEIIKNFNGLGYS